MIIDIIFQVPISLHSDRDNYNKSLVLTKKFEQYIDTNTKYQVIFRSHQIIIGR